MCENRHEIRNHLLQCSMTFFQLVAIFLIAHGFVYFIPELSLSQELGIYRAESEIRRLTYSGDHWVGYPSISDDGKTIAFLEEVRDTSTIAGEIRVKRIIKTMKRDGTDEQVVFSDSTHHAPAPYEDSYLCVGTKPPLISGDGQKVICALSLSEPSDVKDHYLGVVNSDGTGFHTIEFKNEVLSSMD